MTVLLKLKLGMSLRIESSPSISMATLSVAPLPVGADMVRSGATSSDGAEVVRSGATSLDGAEGVRCGATCSG